jgi:nitroreductase
MFFIMSQQAHSNDVTTALKKLRQSRRFLDKPISQDIVRELLEVARWTGSSKNNQPWEFVVVDDKDTIKALSEAGAFTQFLEGSALVIMIVLKGAAPRSEAYDEGRLSERLMIAADSFGIGSGTGWFSTDDAQQRVREILGIPQDHDVWQAVAFGYPDLSQSQRATSAGAGRKPLDELVSYGHYGQRAR